MKHFIPGNRPGRSRPFWIKTIKAMKLTSVLMLFFCFNVQAFTYAQKVNLSVQNSSLVKVLAEIKKQTGYYFLYNSELLDKVGTVSISVKDAELSEVLNKCLVSKGLSYKIIDKTVTISTSTAQTAPRERPIAQEKADIQLRGTVKAAGLNGGSDETVPGVIVTLKGTSRRTITDQNGHFVLTVPENGAVLIFSMMGYQKLEVAVKDERPLNILLKEEMNNLKEVIITGYGTKETKENQVGSAYTVKAVDLEKKPADRIDRLLEGIVPGFQFQVQDATASSSRPRFETRLRGEGSLGASSDPLWIIDGVPLYTGNETNMMNGVQTSISPLTFINPADIESVTVLKDATATTIYGANGSNGVILITTKKGAAGKNRASYNFRAGVNLLTNNRFQVLNADEYRELVTEGHANSASSLPNPVLGNTTNTDWYDVFFRNGLTMDHSLSFSGGNNKSQYFISGEYYKETPIMIANSTDRFSTRVNLKRNVNKALSLNFNLGGSYNINKMFTPGNAYYVNRPTLSPYNEDGSLVIKAYNELASAVHDDYNQKSMALNGNVGGTLKILPGLALTTTNGIDYQSSAESIYQSMNAFSGSLSNGDAGKYNGTSFRWISINRANYSRQIARHGFDGLLGMEASDQKLTSTSATGWGFANDKIREVAYATTRYGSSSASEKSALSLYGKLSYNYDNRYSLVLNYRRDGNSDFGSDVRWAEFSSAGASWTISNEPFWKSDKVNFAKLKLSYGTNGNSRIGSYRAKGIYDFDTNNSYNGAAGAVMTSGENPSLGWETTYLLNAGLDLGFFNSRINLGLEFYRNRTKGALDDINVSWTTGFTKITQNIGSLQNSGIELTLSTENIVKNNFTWETRFNIAHNSNKVLALSEGMSRVYDTRIVRVGEDSRTNYLIRWAGVNPRNGEALWYDALGNITNEFDMNNRVVAGKMTPDYFGGMTNSFVVARNFTFDALIVYSVGGYGFSSLQRDAESDGRNLADENQSRNQLDRWIEPGDLALSPRIILRENANTGRNSTRFLHDKTNIRLQNVSAGYRVPEKLAKSLNLESAYFYLQADNVGFWTPYSSKGNRNTYKNSFSPYPQPTTLSLGLNIGL